MKKFGYLLISALLLTILQGCLSDQGYVPTPKKSSNTTGGTITTGSAELPQDLDELKSTPVVSLGKGYFIFPRNGSTLFGGVSTSSAVTTSQALKRVTTGDTVFSNQLTYLEAVGDVTDSVKRGTLVKDESVDIGIYLNKEPVDYKKSVGKVEEFSFNIDPVSGTSGQLLKLSTILNKSTQTSYPAKYIYLEDNLKKTSETYEIDTITDDNGSGKAEIKLKSSFNIAGMTYPIKVKSYYIETDLTGSTKNEIYFNNLNYQLRKGSNELAMVVVSVNTPANKVFVGKDNVSPITFNVDYVPPVLNLQYPKTGDWVYYNHTSGAIKLYITESKDDVTANTVYLYGLLSSKQYKPSEIDTILSLGGVITSGTSISIEKTNFTTVKLDTANPPTGNPKADFLYLVLMDSNQKDGAGKYIGNKSLTITQIEKKWTADDLKNSFSKVGGTISTLRIKSGTKDFEVYKDDLQITGTDFNFRLELADPNAKVRLYREILENGETVPKPKFLKELTDHTAGSNIYEGTYDLIKDFSFDLSNGTVNLYMEVEDSAYNTYRELLKLTYIDENNITESIRDSDISLYSSAYGVSAPLVTDLISPLQDNTEDKVYLSSDASIKSICLSNPKGLSYTVKVLESSSTTGTDTSFDFVETTVTADKKHYFNISTKAPYSPNGLQLTASNPRKIIKFMLETRVIKTIEIVRITDYGNAGLDSITVNTFKIKQNLGKAFISGTVSSFPYELTNTYQIKASFDNGSTYFTLLDTSVSALENGKIKFESEIPFNKDTALNYVSVIADLKSPKPTVSFTPSAKAKTFDNIPVMITGINDTVKDWIVPEITGQIIDVSNNADADVTKHIDSFDLYLDGGTGYTKVENFTNGSAVNLTGKKKLMISAVSSTNKTTIEREITIKTPNESDIPTLTVQDSPSPYPFASDIDKFVVKGSVSNADKVTIYVYDRNDYILNKSSALKLATQEVVPSGGTYVSSDFSADTDIKQGGEYHVVVTAVKTGGTKLSREFDCYYDTKTPTKNDFITETLYIDSTGALLDDTTNIASINNILSVTSPLTSNPTFAIDDTRLASYQGYAAIVKNQRGYDDFLVVYAPESDANNLYTGTILGEDYSVIAEGDSGSYLPNLPVLIKKDYTVSQRKLLNLRLGDNSGSTKNIKLYMKDKFNNKSAVYTFKNNIDVGFSAPNTISAKITEGSADAPYINVKFERVDNAKQINLRFNKVTTSSTIFLGENRNIDLTNPAGYSFPLSGNINTGDVIRIEASDKYGNNKFLGTNDTSLSVTVQDKLPPNVNIMDVSITNGSFVSGIIANSATAALSLVDKISGSAIEPNATVILYGTLPGQSSTQIKTTKTDSAGKFSFDIAGLDRYSDVKLELIDSAGNSSTESQLYPRYKEEVGFTPNAPDAIVRSYATNVGGLSASPSPTIKLNDILSLTWNPVSSGLSDLHQYKIIYSLPGGKLLEHNSLTTTDTLKADSSIGSYNYTNIGINVYAVSNYGFTSSPATKSDLYLDNLAPVISGGAVDTTKIKASVSTGIITFGSTTLDLSKVGIGDAGDYIDVLVDGLAVGPNQTLTSPSLNTFTPAAGITNSSSFSMILRDKVGNTSSAITIYAFDDKAPLLKDDSIIDPKLASYIRVDAVNSLPNTDMQIKLNYTQEDNVVVYAYDVTAGEDEASRVQIGMIKLGTKSTSAVMNIKNTLRNKIKFILEDEILKDSTGTPYNPSRGGGNRSSISTFTLEDID